MNFSLLSHEKIFIGMNGASGTGKTYISTSDKNEKSIVKMILNNINASSESLNYYYDYLLLSPNTRFDGRMIQSFLRKVQKK